MGSKTNNYREKDIATFVPAQLSPNPARSGGVGGGLSPLSEISSSDPSLIESKPNLDFTNLIERRNGIVLSRDVILKSEHFFKGMNNIESELKLLGAPNFRSTNLNIYGAAQPSFSGLTTILRVLGCGPDASPESKALGKRALWFSTREEPIVYINDIPFVVRDNSNPFVNIKSYSGISGSRLESVEKRLQADIVSESKRNNGLILVHNEQDDHTIIPCLVSVDSVRTPREVLQEIQNNGFSVDYYRIPVSHEQSPTDPYIDEYFKVFAGTRTDWPVIFSCGMGIGRTTYGMVIGLLIRRAQIIHATGSDPFNISQQSLQDFNSKSRTMLRLVYILEQGLQSKQSSQSAIEWILARSGMINQLESALNGNYMVINDLVRVLYNGSLCKQIVDAAIDRCDTVVNIREHILLYRVRSLVQNGPNSSLDTGLGFLERYFSLISFCEYVQSQLFKGNLQSKSFQTWMQDHKEIWKMLTYLRSSNNKHKAFRPIDELSELSGQSSMLAIRSPELKTVGEDVSVVKARSGTVLGPNTILKIDHWSGGRDIEHPAELPLSIQGAPNFRKIDLSFGESHQIYAVAQPTLSALRKILEYVTTESLLPVTRIVWVNVREEPLIYINGEPFVLRDQYASLRNIKAYTGITNRRLEQMEFRLKEDIAAESRAFLNRILLHSEGSNHELLPIWESVNQISTLQELFSQEGDLCEEFPQLEYYRVPITAEEPPEAGDFDLLRRIMTQTNTDETATSSTVFIFNCQMGIGRSTTAAVIGGQILINQLNLACPCQPDHAALIHYKIVTNLLRMIKSGVKSRRVVDCIIDRAGTLVNLRQSIEEYRKRASKCTDDHQSCRKMVMKGMHCLKRYVLLIMFQSFLIESLNPQDSTFTSWIMSHPEFGSLFHDLESKGLEGLSVLSEIESPQATIGDSNSEALTKEPAAELDVKRVVAGREGSVLAPMTILKFDHFFGCQKQSLPERIDGAPNFRRIPLIDGKFVCGLAMPTKEAIGRVLERIECVQEGQRRCLWISMREEPVIFANGQPYVLRIVKDPITNLEMTGIVSERVELMEERLKKEALLESSLYHNRLLLHEEEASHTAPQGFEIIPEWELVEELESPAEVYQHLIQSGNYPLTYYRVPVTDEQAPIPNVFDELIRLISQADYTDFVFNCQMGRGRTTTGMVITMLYHRIKSMPIEEMSTPEARNSIITSPVSFLLGEYKLIHRLCQVLDHGLRAKQLADECIDALAHLQNLREAIYDYKRKLEANPSGPQANELESRGVHYLLRYFYLIVFAEYLIEEMPTGSLSKSFLQWISERREITNLTLYERGELNLK